MNLSINEKMNLFYQLTHIPVHLFSDYEHLFSFASPESPLQSHYDWFYKEVHNSLISNQAESIINLSNEYDEAFLIAMITIHDKKYYILCGPYLISNSHSEFVNKLIIKRKASLTDREILMKYFSTTILVDEKKNLLFKQLFNELFTSQANDIKENSLSEKFYIHRIENKESWYTHPPYMIEQKLLVHIKEGQVKEAEEMAQILNTYHDASLAKNPVRSFKNSLICRCTLYTRAVIEGGVDSELAFTMSDTYINEIEKRSDIQDLYLLDIRMIGEFIKLINGKINRMYSPLVQSAIKIVNESVNQRISVEQIAGKIPTNPSYLSQVFKKEVGTPLSVYINRLKIEEAKYFLSFTDSPLADIASFFQFSSQSHFTSIFKSFVGMTPYIYRKNYKNTRDTLHEMK